MPEFESALPTNEKAIEEIARVFEKESRHPYSGIRNRLKEVFECQEEPNLEEVLSTVSLQIIVEQLNIFFEEGNHVSLQTREEIKDTFELVMDDPHLVGDLHRLEEEFSPILPKDTRKRRFVLGLFSSVSRVYKISFVAQLPNDQEIQILCEELEEAQGLYDPENRAITLDTSLFDEISDADSVNRLLTSIGVLGEVLIHEIDHHFFYVRNNNITPVLDLIAWYRESLQSIEVDYLVDDYLYRSNILEKSAFYIQKIFREFTLQIKKMFELYTSHNKFENGLLLIKNGADEFQNVIDSQFPEEELSGFLRYLYQFEVLQSGKLWPIPVETIPLPIDLDSNRVTSIISLVEELLLEHLADKEDLNFEELKDFYYKTLKELIQNCREVDEKIITTVLGFYDTEDLGADLATQVATLKKLSYDLNEFKKLADELNELTDEVPEEMAKVAIFFPAWVSTLNTGKFDNDFGMAKTRINGFKNELREEVKRRRSNN